jgi:hypothetical protein
MDVRPEMHGRRVDRRLVAAAVVAIVVGLGWSLRNVVFYQYTRDFCDVTGSWRITMAYFGQFQSAKIAPSPLEAEAQRRDIAVRHHWQSVEWRTRSLSGGTHALAALLTVAPEPSADQLRRMSDDELRHWVTRTP